MLCMRNSARSKGKGRQVSRSWYVVRQLLDCSLPDSKALLCPLPCTWGWVCNPPPAPGDLAPGSKHKKALPFSPSGAHRSKALDELGGSPPAICRLPSWPPGVVPHPQLFLYWDVRKPRGQDDPTMLPRAPCALHSRPPDGPHHWRVSA